MMYIQEFCFERYYKIEYLIQLLLGEIFKIFNNLKEDGGSYSFYKQLFEGDFSGILGNRGQLQLGQGGGGQVVDGILSIRLKGVGFVVRGVYF